MKDIPSSPREVVQRLKSDKRVRPPGVPYHSPIDDLERSLAEIWSEVLRIDVIGRNDNLFDLEGDSLHMMLISSRIRRRYQIEIAIDKFFDDPTLANVAAMIRANTQRHASADDRGDTP